MLFEFAELPTLRLHLAAQIKRLIRNNGKAFVFIGGPTRTRTWDQGIMSPLL